MDTYMSDIKTSDEIQEDTTSAYSLVQNIVCVILLILIRNNYI